MIHFYSELSGQAAKREALFITSSFDPEHPRLYKDRPCLFSGALSGPQGCAADRLPLIHWDQQKASQP